MKEAVRLRSNLLKVASSYANATGLSLATVAARAGYHPSVLSRIAGGDTVDLRVNGYDRAMDWFRDNWPEGARRPKELK